MNLRTRKIMCVKLQLENTSRIIIEYAEEILLRLQ